MIRQPARTYYLSIVESHVDANVDVWQMRPKNIVCASLTGDAALISFALGQLAERIDHDEEYVVHLHGQATPFGVNDAGLLCEALPGSDVCRAVSEAIGKAEHG